MKKFESAILDDLSDGDRFYFSLDTKKKVWEKKVKADGSTVHLVGGGKNMCVSKYKSVVFLSSRTVREALQ